MANQATIERPQAGPAAAVPRSAPEPTPEPQHEPAEQALPPRPKWATLGADVIYIRHETFGGMAANPLAVERCRQAAKIVGFMDAPNPGVRLITWHNLTPREQGVVGVQFGDGKTPGTYCQRT